MPQVKKQVVRPPVVRRKPLGKQKLPEERRRVILSTRVLPSTIEYLDGMGYSTVGRALDTLVSALRHPGIFKMLEAKKSFNVISLLS